MSQAMQGTAAIAKLARAGLGLLGLAWLMSATVPAAANDGEAVVRRAADTALPSDLRREGWKVLAVPGKAEAQFAPHKSDGIRIRADNAVAFLYRAVPGEMNAKRRLAWRWRVDEAVARTDLTRIGQDDRSLAVHLVFPMEGETLPFWERIDLALTRIFAPPLAGKVLTYVWGGTQARGARLANPHLGRHGRLIVLRSGDAATGRWFMEDIDFAADFRRAFGYDPPPPSFLAISSDSDDSEGRSLGIVADLVFG